MFDIDLTKILERLGKTWHRPSTLLTLIVLIPLLLILFLGTVDLQKLSRLHWSIILLATALTVGTWFLSRRVPRNLPDRVGFIIAITAESSAQGRRIRTDFVEEIRRLLAEARPESPFHLVVYPDYISARILTFDDARRALAKSRSHFILWGTAKLRQVMGQERHMLSLEGAVVHGRTSPEIQQNLSTEFTELLPRRVIFEKENDVFSFQFTSQWAELVARYIMGIAAAISGDSGFAEELFKSVQARLATNSELPPALRKIQTRLPIRFIEILDYRVSQCYQAWWSTRDVHHLREAEEHLRGLERLAPNHYSSHLTRAICHFVIRRDLAAARREIRACRSEPDATWRYSDAFLTAYEGNLKKAYRFYRAAFRKHCDPAVPIQSEEFINEILIQEPEKYYLCFCLGLINFYAKEDYEAAVRDCGRFLDQGSPSEYPTEREIARQLVYEARAIIGAAKEGTASVA